MSESPFESNALAPDQVTRLHRNSDVDASPFAQHHTIGEKPNQAADGKVVADLVKLVKQLESRIEVLEP